MCAAKGLGLYGYVSNIDQHPTLWFIQSTHYYVSMTVWPLPLFIFNVLRGHTYV